MVHRGQVLLLLAVGVLAGVAIAGVCLQLDGASILGRVTVDQLFDPPRSQLPGQIVIGPRAVAPTDDSAVVASAGANGAAPPPASPGANAARPVAGPALPHPVPTTAVVPAVVYTYAPDDHGGGTPGGGSGGGRDGGGGK